MLTSMRLPNTAHAIDTIFMLAAQLCLSWCAPLLFLSVAQCYSLKPRIDFSAARACVGGLEHGLCFRTDARQREFPVARSGVAELLIGLHRPKRPVVEVTELTRARVPNRNS